MNVLVEQFLQTLAAGLLIGCIYGLLCVGLAFIFGIMRVINFAQGDLMMVGMYLAIFIGSYVLPATVFGLAAPFLSALVAGPVLFGLGYLLNRFLISRTTGLQAWFKKCHFQVTPEIDRALIVRGFLVLGVTLI